MENLILFIIALVGGAICFGFLIYELVVFCKKRTIGQEVYRVDSKHRSIFIAFIAGQGALALLSCIGLQYGYKWEMNSGDIVMMVIGSLLFGSGFACLVSSFVLYYYRPDLDPKQRHIARILTFVCVGVFVLGTYLMTQGIADYLRYPLPNSISFKTLFGYPNPGDYGFTIAFYGILIVSGAIISYFVSDHYFYKKFKKHGILETLLLVAFPAGLIGARLWYCLVLEPSKYLANPVLIFDIRSGGMAIQGGAIFGILAGVLFMLRFRKYVDIRFAIDVIVPTILIAQAVGRLGNFFNCEVHGNPVSMDAWLLLPRIFANNLHWSVEAGYAPDGTIFLPLFFIEALMNIGGYFIIRYAISKPLKKWLPIGSQAGLYLAWYGMTRVILEPLRFGAFEYGQSWITAWIMFGGGLLLVGGFALWNYFEYKKTGKWKTFENV